MIITYYPEIDFKILKKFLSEIREIINKVNLDPKNLIRQSDDESFAFGRVSEKQFLYYDCYGEWFLESFFLLLISSLDYTLQDICKLVQKKRGFPFSISQIKHHGQIKSYRKYLFKVGLLQKPDDEMWNKIGVLYDIRSALIHKRGIISQNKLENVVKLKNTMKKNYEYDLHFHPVDSRDPKGDFRINCNYYFCYYVLHVIDDFVTILNHEMEKLYPKLYPVPDIEST